MYATEYAINHYGVRDTVERAPKDTKQHLIYECYFQRVRPKRNNTENKQANNRTAQTPTTKTNPGKISGFSEQRREEVKRFNPPTPAGRMSADSVLFGVWMEGGQTNNGGGMIW